MITNDQPLLKEHVVSWKKTKTNTDEYANSLWIQWAYISASATCFITIKLCCQSSIQRIARSYQLDFVMFMDCYHGIVPDR